MAYQALYRRFRPRKFGDVVGQDHITTILLNQIVSGRVSHAYLFCGTRGTGKTSTAHIFARALMCERHASGEACGECPTCIQNAQGGTDIVEIDAASNNGVDEIRDLRDKTRLSPLYASHKAYIIDEVHMLTTAAFNALLKTLEEPPPHVVFILATTEPQKLPATILSRCQRYDFHRVSVPAIVGRLTSVLSEVGAHVDEEGLKAIAFAAEGALRDALSLLDQCLAFFGNNVSNEQVRQVLGSMDVVFLLDMADALIDSDAARALAKLDEVSCFGRDLLVFTRDMTQHFRALMMLSVCGEDAFSMLGMTREAFDALAIQAKRCPVNRSLRAIALLSETESRLKYAPSPRVLLDAALVRLCRPEDEDSVLALQERVASLEAHANASPAPKAPPQKDARRSPVPKKPDEKPDDAPPWESAPRIEPATKKPPEPVPPLEKTDNPEQDSAPPPEEPPCEVIEPSGQAQNAAQIFEGILTRLSKENLAIYPLARRYSHVTLDADALVVHFSGANTIYMEALQKPATHALLTRLLQEAQPGLLLRYACSERNEQAIAKAAALFGEQNITIKKTL